MCWAVEGVYPTAPCHGEIQSGPWPTHGIGINMLFNTCKKKEKKKKKKRKSEKIVTSTLKMALFSTAFVDRKFRY